MPRACFFTGLAIGLTVILFPGLALLRSTSI